MKTRTANDIRRDIGDAYRRLRELGADGNAAIPTHLLAGGYFADDAIECLNEIIEGYEQELEKAIRYGEQLVLAF